MKTGKWLIILLISFIYGSCDCADEPLEEVLGQPCMIDSDKPDGYFLLTDEEAFYINTGICRHGIVSRNEEGDKACINQINPEYETCNGLDDDCDNVIDNPYIVNRGHWESDNECVGLGVCRFTEQVCVNGMYVCDYPDSYGEETCDGRDNDCDGEIDEDTEEDPIFDAEERYVYLGDPDTINVGECRAGYKECVDGRVSLRNMRTPIPEICGNDDDDDCDGYTDEREDENLSNDIVFIIDYSGSMSGVIQSVSDALCDWSSQGVLTTSRFAVVAIGFVDNTTTWKETKVLTDFTDSGTACTIIRQNNRTSNQGGAEFQLDAIYDVNDPNSAQINLSWSGNQRKIFMFSDEQMQYSFAGLLEDALNMIVEQCIQQSYVIGAFISYNDINQQEWVDLTTQCGGFLDYLSSDPRRMIDAMNYWIGTDC